MKRFAAALGVVCLISFSVLAGDIPTLGAPQPASTATEVELKPGDIPSGGVASQLSDEALNALLGFLSF
jgi:hypothetical protein